MMPRTPTTDATLARKAEMGWVCPLLIVPSLLDSARSKVTGFGKHVSYYDLLLSLLVDVQVSLRANMAGHGELGKDSWAGWARRCHP
jgi:hypothetical protein